MNIYTGIDIVKNSRVEGAYRKFGERFLKRVYTDSEIDYCKKKVDFIECLSARFAAKEAVIKAFYKVCNEKLPLNKIEIKGSKGKPAELLLHSQYGSLTNWNIDISISHEEDFSIAIAILYID